MLDIANDMFASPDYTNRAEARSEKANGSWADVEPHELDRELDEHLNRYARRAGGMADQHSGDDVVLERAGTTNSGAAQ